MRVDRIPDEPCYRAAESCRYDFTLPPFGPRPLLFRRSSLRLKQLLLRKRSAIPSTPIGPKALSLRSSSTRLADEAVMPVPKCFYNNRYSKKQPGIFITNEIEVKQTKAGGISVFSRPVNMSLHFAR